MVEHVNVVGETIFSGALTTGGTAAASAMISGITVQTIA
jgi:hypothetical protein